jgi:hypothetical protein
MATQPAGSTWLQKHFNLNRHILTHSSYIGHNPSIELTSEGKVEQVYGIKCAPENMAINHLEFSLKYDDLNLDFLKTLWSVCRKQRLLPLFILRQAGNMQKNRLPAMNF